MLFHLGAAILAGELVVSAVASEPGATAAPRVDEPLPAVGGYDIGDFEPPEGCAPISGVRHRQHVLVGGRVHAVRVQPWSGVATLEMTLVDRTGAITIVFLGRRHLPGVGTGTRLVVQGVVGEHQGRLAILNPTYDILPGPEADG